MISKTTIRRTDCRRDSGGGDIAVSILESGAVFVSNPCKSIIYRINISRTEGEDDEMEKEIEGVPDSESTHRKYGFVLFDIGSEIEAVSIILPVRMGEDEIDAFLTTDDEEFEKRLSYSFDHGNEDASIALIRIFSKDN